LPLGSFDGYADSIESAIYLVNREPVAEAFDWIDSEMQVMLGMQRPDGHLEDWYGEGNFNRTALLYAYMKSQGVRPERWEPGVGVGAVAEGDRLVLHIAAPAPRRVQFDHARHRRILRFDRNYVRLNEFPEWFVVEPNRLYELQRAGDSGEPLVRLGSELIAGIELEPGDWLVARLQLLLVPISRYRSGSGHRIAPAIAGWRSRRYGRRGAGARVRGAAQAAADDPLGRDRPGRRGTRPTAARHLHVGRARGQRRRHRHARGGHRPHARDR
jgi:hypothetical protein